MQSGRQPLLVVLGTRPEAIKLWPLVLKAKELGISICVVSTGQQKDLLRQTLNDLDFDVDFYLEPPKTILSPETFVFETASRLKEIIERISPRLVLVQGDTGSALAGALAAFFSKIPVGHVEAGLRSHDLLAPWPEEGNRRLIDSISKYLWVPTLGDSYPNESKDQEVIVVGNTVVDALRIILGSEKNVRPNKSKKILVTLHRRESFGAPLISTMKKLVELSQLVDHEIIFYQHPNPNVENAIINSKLEESRVKIESPLPYREFIKILHGVDLLITDSGGLQEEATTLKIPLLVVRDTTERQSGVSESMQSRLVGSSGEHLIESALEFLSNPTNNDDVVSFSEIYGDGNSAERILSSACKELKA